MAIPIGTLLLLGAVAFVSLVGGAMLGVLGFVLWDALDRLRRIEERGQLYKSDMDNEQARKINAAVDVATGMEFMRQALRKMSPEMAREFYAPEPEKKGKVKK